MVTSKKEDTISCIRNSWLGMLRSDKSMADSAIAALIMPLLCMFANNRAMTLGWVLDMCLWYKYKSADLKNICHRLSTKRKTLVSDLTNDLHVVRALAEVSFVMSAPKGLRAYFKSRCSSKVMAPARSGGPSTQPEAPLSGSPPAWAI